MNKYGFVPEGFASIARFFIGLAKVVVVLLSVLLGVLLGWQLFLWMIAQAGQAWRG